MNNGVKILVRRDRLGGIVERWDIVQAQRFVESFSIARNGQVISQGSDGLLWMDIVYQSFNAAAQAAISSATWNFFSIQFPELNQALMVTVVLSNDTGSLPVASLFTTDASRTVSR